MKPTTRDAYWLMHQGALALNELTANGIAIDTGYCRRQEDKLSDEISSLKQKLLKTKEFKTWKNIYGQSFNIKSNKQLGDVLFNHMGHTPIKFSDDEGKNPSVDKEALETLDIPMVKVLVRLRKTRSARERLRGIMRETVDGFMHPFFGLHLMVSYRSQSSRMNFQNMDKRDKRKKKIVRRSLCARPGRQLGEFDYGQQEVRVAACTSHDPVLIDYIVNEGDMHLDMAMEIYLLDEDEVSYEARDCAKNRFVFPEFYGDWYKTCTKNLWEGIGEMSVCTKSGTPMKEHLRDQGIKSYKQFEKHLQGVEDRFWHERFKVFDAWREDLWRSYLKWGYVDLVTGFRCYETMKKNECLNRPIQGPAFHCLLWTIIQLNKHIKKQKMDTLMVGQIHDSGIADIVPDECDDFLHSIVQIGTLDIREHWDWLIVPLEVDFGLSPIDGSWYDKEDYEL